MYTFPEIDQSSRRKWYLRGTGVIRFFERLAGEESRTRDLQLWKYEPLSANRPSVVHCIGSASCFNTFAAVSSPALRK